MGNHNSYFLFYFKGTNQPDSPMKRLFKILIIVFVVSVIIGGILEAMSIEERIAEDIEEVMAEVQAKKVEASDSEPNWSNYTPELKERILNSDCSELQREFDTAADNSDRQRARTGEGNLDLMNYIDERLRMKGCY